MTSKKKEKKKLKERIIKIVDSQYKMMRKGLGEKDDKKKS